MINILKKIISNKYYIYILITLTYLLIDIFLRYFCIKSIYFYSIYNISPLLFNFSIITLNIFIINLLNKKWGTIFYIISFLLNLILAAVQYFHYQILGTFFTFSELFLAGEGFTYLNSIITHINLKLIICAVILLVLFILSIIGIKKISLEKMNAQKIFIAIFIIFILQFVGIFYLYVNDNGYYKTDNNSPIYNYKNYEIPYKSLQVTGLLQYSIQDMIIYYKNKIIDIFNKLEYKNEVKEYLENRGNLNQENDYTGIFKDKNLIYIMLESGDDWLITEEDMPTLYKMQQTGWNFTNRYSPFFYSGYTFNAEFAANTGLYLNENFDAFVNNSFPYSLPNLFKENGYIVNSFHMNKGDFYQRNKFHKAFGYTNHYSNYYRDKNTISKGYNYLYDEEWINNPETYELLVPKGQKFMSFLITYSMHLPYINNGICDEAIKEGKIKFNTWEEREPECIKYLAKQSDLMFEKLLEKLKEDNILKDTVIIVFTDHNAYGLTDKKLFSK